MTLLGRRALAIPGALLAGAGLALNVLAYRHARAFTTFEKAGERTPRPERLTASQKLSALFTGPTLPKPRNERTPADVGLAYERLAFPNGDGHTLEAWSVRASRDAAGGDVTSDVPGGRGTVVLFHGYADCKDSLLEPARAFVELGWNALLVDFRGSGGSSGYETSVGYHEARDVAAAARVARELGAGPLVLYGVSMGAAAVLRAVAVEGVSADALVLEAPFDRMLATVENRFATLGAPAFPSAQLLLFWGGRQQGFDAFRHNPVDYAARVELPTLMLHGRLDGRVPVAQARSVFRALRGPKRLEVFEGLAHESLAAGAAERWKAAVAGLHALAEAPLPN